MPIQTQPAASYTKPCRRRMSAPRPSRRRSRRPPASRPPPESRPIFRASPSRPTGRAESSPLWSATTKACCIPPTTDVFASGEGTTFLTLTGHLPAINASLATLTYQGTATGDDWMWVGATNPQGQQGTKNIVATDVASIAQVIVPPVVTTPPVVTPLPPGAPPRHCLASPYQAVRPSAPSSSKSATARAFCAPLPLPA